MRAHALILSICTLAVLTRLWLGPYVVDDAYITFRYSQNLAAGYGFTYNPPDRVQGTSSPLLALGLSAFSRVRLDLGWTMLTISAIADVTAILCGSAILIRAGWPIAALIYGLSLAFWPAYLTYSVSGLESSTYVALLALSWRLADRGHAVATGLTAALATLCRPDGVLGAVALLPFLWRRGAADVRRGAVAYSCTLLPWVVFAALYFGTVIPHSLVAKAQTRLTASESLLALSGRFLDGIYLPLTAAGAAGALFLCRSRRPVFSAVALWWFAYAMVFVVTGAFGPYPWYYVPLLPPYFACLGAACERVLRVVWRRAVPPAVGVATVIGFSLLFGARMMPLRATLERWFDTREYLYRDVATNLLSRQDCTLAATEIGTLGYFYRGRILDLVGLVTPEVTRRSLGEIFDRNPPCWVVSYDTHLPSSLVGDPDFAGRYEIVLRRPVSAGRELQVFKLVNR